MSVPPPVPFIIIGENIHTSRVVRRDGSRIAETASGQPAVRVPLEDGEALLPVPPRSSRTHASSTPGRVKHVMAAVLEGMANGPDAAIATAPTCAGWRLARSPAAPAYLDLNVDEVSPDVDASPGAPWPGSSGRVGPVSTVPLSIDSSDSSVMTVGTRADRPGLGRAAHDRS